MVYIRAIHHGGLGVADVLLERREMRGPFKALGRLLTDHVPTV